MRQILKRILTPVTSIQVIGEAESGEEALQKLTQCHPDVILLDMNLPDISALMLTKRIKRDLPLSRIIILTAQKSTQLPRRLFNAGAVGYLTKDQAPADIINAIESASVLQPTYSATLVADQAFNNVAPYALQQKFANLSDKELLVVRAIAKGEGTTAIARALHLSPKTVNCYRHHIFQKLGVANDVELTYLAIKLDLLP